MSVAQPEFVDNPEARCAVVLLLDTSTSMAGQPIAELNAGIQTFKAEIESDSVAAQRVELGVVTFGGVVSKAHDFSTLDSFPATQLTANGGTPLFGAVREGLDLLEARKNEYKKAGIKYFRPIMMLITDGAPTDDDNGDVARLHEHIVSKKVSFFAVGVQGADMARLSQVAHSSTPPMMLRGTNFKELMRWLSSSAVKISTGKVGGEMVQLPPVTGWAQTTT